MALQAPRGTGDLLPEATAVWNWIERRAREVFERHGYREIRTPIFEDLRLFARSIGETTDIVEKEMYTFSRGEETFALRPEATASVVRAYLEHRLDKGKPFQKFYYIGPMFRYERPQAGRTRQFHQLGIEAIGSTDPRLDVETILLAAAFFRAIQLPGYEIRINTLGCTECQGRLRRAIRKFLQPVEARLCDDCRRRMDRNVFRVLDCKRTRCRTVLEDAPNIHNVICPACAEHFTSVQNLLTATNTPYEVCPHLVRGFDYYTSTVYEIVHEGLGAQDALLGGGRYDRLVSDHGGPDLGAVGFAIGFERVVMALGKDLHREIAAASPLRAYIVAFTDAARPEAFQLATELRRAGIAVDLDYEGRSGKAQLRQAQRLGVPYALFLGPDELAAGRVTVREMRRGEQHDLPRAQIVEAFRNVMEGIQEGP